MLKKGEKEVERECKDTTDVRERAKERAGKQRHKRNIIVILF